MKKSFVNDLWETAFAFVNPMDFYRDFKEISLFSILNPIGFILGVYLSLKSILVLIPVIVPFKLVVWAVENKRRRVVL